MITLRLGMATINQPLHQARSSLISCTGIPWLEDIPAT